MSSTFLLEDRALIYCQVLLCVFVYVVTMPIHVHTLLYANCPVLYIHVHMYANCTLLMYVYVYVYKVVEVG